jgi:positive regulator of sigma E activity
MDNVEHLGIVGSINGKSMRVRIDQATACSGCHAGKVCSSADKQEKWIDIPSFSGSYQVGQRVVVEGKSSAGLMAVFLAYLIPLVLMMAALALSSLWLFPGKDGIAALSALAVTMFYYVLLYPFRRYLQSRFVFTVRPTAV